MSRRIALLFLLSCLPSTARAQPPARDVARPAPGTSIVRGRVVAADTGRAIRGVAVRATAPENPAGRSALTDAQGAFEMKNLPAGRYTLTASKQTFITLEYGQTRPFQSGKPLVVSENQTVEKVDFSLPRGGVIAGRLLDDLGEPVVGLTVRAMRPAYAQGRRELQPVGSVVATNDIGEYRIFGLSPGRYFVSATVRLALGSDAAPTGFASTYYPSVTSLDSAQAVTVGLGQTVPGIDLTLTPVKTATISGTAVDADGRPLSRGTLNLIHRAPAFAEGIGAASLGPDGRFRLSNVPPGDYNLDLDSTGSSPGAAIDATRRIVKRVVVEGTDIDGVVLAAARMSGAVGRLVLPAGASVPSGSVRLSPFPADTSEFRWFASEAIVKDDLTFDLTSPPGQMIIRATSLPRGWALKEVRFDGRVVTDRGAALPPGEKVKDVEVELTNSPPTIAGAVRNAKGDAVDDYAVVVFSQRAESRNGSPRYFAVARPDQSGGFRVTTLAPGDYFAVALEYVDPREAADPEVLARLEQRAVRVTIREGESVTLDLKLAGQ